MSTQTTSTTTLSFLLSSSFKPPSSLPPPQRLQSIQSRGKQFWSGLRSLRCNATPNPGTQQGSSTQEMNKDVFQSDYRPLIKTPDHDHKDSGTLQVQSHQLKVDDVKEQVNAISSMLKSMGDGEISVSPYDTAWVALVKDLDGKPQFPTSVGWIANNQLDDGSWGDKDLFEAHDRIMNTLACVIALTSWNIHPEKCDRGMEFIRLNLWRLGEEKDEHMPIGFEVAFPSLIEIGRALGIHLLDHSGALQRIYQQRNIKLQRIPKEILHRKPTTLLHSLEGMEGLDWDKLINLQSKDGSFLFSPASTAFALINTGDFNCFTYLERAVSNFHGGVPNVYPVDLFEHIWVVDRLQRLGISRFFKDEINECMEYVHRYWTDKGICWARNSEVQDIDDTAMGFRLLRLYGYNVSPDVFEHFRKDGEFFCFAGQSTQAVTGMYNLFRASQLQYPSEAILDGARHFSSKFLREKQACNQLFDKWIITKDLPGEVGYALDLPLYANLPRIETRLYLEQYGGDDDVWIGKTLYRMPYVNNDVYLNLAKSDYETCQTLHKLEWESFRRWYDGYNLKEYGLSQSKLLQLYFVAAASIFEPERSSQRLAWAKTWALVEAIASHFNRLVDPNMCRRVSADEFLSSWNNESSKGLFGPLQSTLRQLSLDQLVTHGIDIHNELRQAWEKWVISWAEDGDRYGAEAELVARTIQACATPGGLKGRGEDYQQLVDITNKICHQLGHLKDVGPGCGGPSVAIPSEVNADMQRLLEMVLSDNGLDATIKQSYWEVARSYYYTAYCSPATINAHLEKVVFERVSSS